jgi:hypothetical protein
MANESEPALRLRKRCPLTRIIRVHVSYAGMFGWLSMRSKAGVPKVYVNTVIIDELGKPYIFSKYGRQTGGIIMDSLTYLEW